MPVPRKILIRVIGAPLLVAALCGIIYWNHAGKTGTPLRILLLVVGAVSLYEVYAMCAVKGIATASWVGIAALAVSFLPPTLPNVGLGPLETSSLTWIPRLFPIYLLLKLVFRYGRFTPEGAALSYFGFVYINLLSYALTAPAPFENHSYWLLFLLAAGKGSDMAAFVAGKSIGKRPMTPVISPNKTWEGGIAGGIVGTALGMVVLLATPLKGAFGRFPVAALLFFSLMVTIVSQVGDLVKSAFKRWAGVKDSGRILPEFGGMLDMVDSFILSAPVAWYGYVLLQFLFKGA
jgi:phosphatidate cytidylyltransferase